MKKMLLYFGLLLFLGCQSSDDPQTVTRTNFDHAAFLAQKIQIDGEGTYTYRVIAENKNERTYEIRPVNSDDWVYVFYETEEDTFSQNVFQLTLSDNSAPIRLEFNSVFERLEAYKDVYITAQKSDNIDPIPPEMVAQFKGALDYMNELGFGLDSLKFILYREEKGKLASTLGTDTIIYNLSVQDAFFTQQEESRWDVAYAVGVHELFHVVDGRNDGLSQTEEWIKAYEVALDLADKGNYFIPNEGCGGIFDAQTHYELTSEFEFFAVCMTARVNPCDPDRCNAASSNDVYSANTNCYGFRDDMMALNNSTKLKQLFPKVYELGTALLEN